MPYQRKGCWREMSTSYPLFSVQLQAQCQADEVRKEQDPNLSEYLSSLKWWLWMRQRIRVNDPVRYTKSQLEGGWKETIPRSKIEIVQQALGFVVFNQQRVVTRDEAI